MSNVHSIWFQAGPYRRWGLTLTGFDHWAGDGSGRILVQAETSATTDGLRGHLWLAEGSDGYEVTAAALETDGREPMERALTWLLAAMAVRVADPEDVIDQRLRDHWQAVVDRGRAAREEFTARWGDGPEPALQVVGTLLFDSNAGAIGGR